MRAKESEKAINRLANIYGFADFTFELMMMGAVSYYAYFLTDIAMISAASMAVILLVARIGDAISVPITGIIIQSIYLKWGQFRSWLLVVPPFTCMFFILMFSNPQFAPLMKAIFLGTCYVFAHICVNLAYNAHLGLMEVIARSPEDQLKLSQKKSQFQFAANTLFAITFMPLVRFFGKSCEWHGFFITMAVFSILQVVGYWNVFYSTKGYEACCTVKSEEKNCTSLLDMFQQVCKNSQLLALLLSDSAKNTGMFVVSALLTYYYKYVVGNLDIISIHILAVSLASFLGSLIAPVIVHKIGKRNVYIYTAIFNAIILGLARLGKKTNFVVFISAVSIGNLLLAIAMSITPVLYSDAAEYAKWKNGKDSKAFTMSMFSMPIKIGIALGGAIAGYGLALINYSPSTKVSHELVNGIVDLITLIPIACSMISAIIFALFYKLDDVKVSQIIKFNGRNEKYE
ncbi:MFS transporter [Tepidanaerobacter syntrophicus]|uniref:MFS transporter n=1 Tax=Tepidanaerobacter syntrophicus TaxID=224999 RepID=UPI001BD51C24|nr:MFS transporter [Tepidanaerobacter syntrophicus]